MFASRQGRHGRAPTRPAHSLSATAPPFALARILEEICSNQAGRQDVEVQSDPERGVTPSAPKRSKASRSASSRASAGGVTIWTIA